MDGVLVNSEQTWYKYGSEFLNTLFGKNVLAKMGELIGITIDEEYELATSYGFRMSKDEFYRRYDEQALGMYSKSIITQNIDSLLQTLKNMGYKIALVSASRKLWIDQVLQRISSKDLFDYVLSLNGRVDLKPKPHPDGYTEAIKILSASPQKTIILEDSNRGIAASKAAGAFTIAYTQHLVPGYVQVEADAKAKNVYEVLKIVKKFERVLKHFGNK